MMVTTTEVVSKSVPASAPVTSGATSQAVQEYETLFAQLQAKYTELYECDQAIAAIEDPLVFDMVGASNTWIASALRVQLVNNTEWQGLKSRFLAIQQDIRTITHQMRMANLKITRPYLFFSEEYDEQGI